MERVDAFDLVSNCVMRYTYVKKQPKCTVREREGDLGKENSSERISVVSKFSPQSTVLFIFDFINMFWSCDHQFKTLYLFCITSLSWLDWNESIMSNMWVKHLVGIRGYWQDIKWMIDLQWSRLSNRMTGLSHKVWRRIRLDIYNLPLWWSFVISLTYWHASKPWWPFPDGVTLA